MIKSKVKAILQNKNMTQIDLAAKLKVQPETLSRTINGNPTLKSLTDIAKALDIEVVELFSKNQPTGHIEYGNDIYAINSINDIKSLLVTIQNSVK
jgi:transcriptional regulator with XRE-family HTH domain